MRCPSNDVLLLDHAAGALKGAERDEWFRHTAECSRCAAVVAAHKTLWAELDEWEAPEISPSFDAELFRRIDAESSKARGFRDWLRFGWVSAIPVAAAAMALVLGFFHDQSGFRAVAPPTQVPVLSAADAEQVEGAVDDLELMGQIDGQQDTSVPDSI